MPMLPNLDVEDAGPAVNSSAPRLSRGPMLGNVSARSATFWVRADDAAEWAVRIWPEAEPNQVRRIVGPTLRKSSDYVGVQEVAGLRPNTSYAYQVELGASGAALAAVDDQSSTFHTFGDQAGRLRVVLGADIGGQSKQPIFDQIDEVKPDLVLLLGDQVYADSAFDFVEYSQAYKDNWGIRNLAQLLRRVPAFMMWDDHEIVDDYWRGSSERYAPARLAYEVFVNARNPAPARAGKLYYRIDAGDVSFFVLDVRSDRSAPNDPDGPNKTMLGDEQKRDVLDWLRCSKAKLKVIASPVTFSAWGTTVFDSWAGYAHEREELFSFIEAHAIDDVLLLSGDQHWSAIFQQERPHYRFYEFMPTPLSKGRRQAPQDATPEILARDDDHYVFGVVDIDTAQTPLHVDLTLCAEDKPCSPGNEPVPDTGLDLEGAQDNVPFTLHLTGQDLGVR